MNRSPSNRRRRRRRWWFQDDQRAPINLRPRQAGATHRSTTSAESIGFENPNGKSNSQTGKFCMNSGLNLKLITRKQGAQSTLPLISLVTIIIHFVSIASNLSLIQVAHGAPNSHISLMNRFASAAATSTEPTPETEQLNQQDLRSRVQPLQQQPTTSIHHLQLVKSARMTTYLASCPPEASIHPCTCIYHTPNAFIESESLEDSSDEETFFEINPSVTTPFSQSLFMSSSSSTTTSTTSTTTSTTAAPDSEPKIQPTTSTLEPDIPIGTASITLPELSSSSSPSTSDSSIITTSDSTKSTIEPTQATSDSPALPEAQQANSTEPTAHPQSVKSEQDGLKSIFENLVVTINNMTVNLSGPVDISLEKIESSYLNASHPLNEDVEQDKEDKLPKQDADQRPLPLASPSLQPQANANPDQTSELPSSITTTPSTIPTGQIFDLITILPFPEQPASSPRPLDTTVTTTTAPVSERLATNATEASVDREARLGETMWTGNETSTQSPSTTTASGIEPTTSTLRPDISIGTTSISLLELPSSTSDPSVHQLGGAKQSESESPRQNSSTTTSTTPAPKIEFKIQPTNSTLEPDIPIGNTSLALLELSPIPSSTLNDLNTHDARSGGKMQNGDEHQTQSSPTGTSTTPAPNIEPKILLTNSTLEPDIPIANTSLAPIELSSTPSFATSDLSVGSTSGPANPTIEPTRPTSERPTSPQAQQASVNEQPTQNSSITIAPPLLPRKPRISATASNQSISNAISTMHSISHSTPVLVAATNSSQQAGIAPSGQPGLLSAPTPSFSNITHASSPARRPHPAARPPAALSNSAPKPTNETSSTRQPALGTGSSRAMHSRHTNNNTTNHNHGHSRAQAAGPSGRAQLLTPNSGRKPSSNPRSHSRNQSQAQGSNSTNAGAGSQMRASNSSAATSLSETTNQGHRSRRITRFLSDSYHTYGLDGGEPKVEILAYCRNIQNAQVLRDAIKGFRGHQINYFVIESCKVPAFPNDIFEGVDVRWLEMANSTVQFHNNYLRPRRSSPLVQLQPRD